MFSELTKRFLSRRFGQIALATATTAAMTFGLIGAASAGQGTPGNGAPSGAHYNLNLIGVPKGKSADMTGNNGHRIFVPLWGSTKILLSEGDYQVLDANGTDGSAAFQLPNPDEDGDGETSYSVYVRALGKPGGKATMQSCYEETDGSTWCAVDFLGGVEPITIERTKGKSTFTNVSKDLLYVDYCTEWAAGPDGVLDTADDVCTNVEQIPLFSNDLIEYFWQYDNDGLKLAQLRFYEVPTDTGFGTN